MFRTFFVFSTILESDFISHCPCLSLFVPVSSTKATFAGSVGKGDALRNSIRAPHLARTPRGRSYRSAKDSPRERDCLSSIEQIEFDDGLGLKMPYTVDLLEFFLQLTLV